MSNVLLKIAHLRIVPALVIDEPLDATELAEAMIAGELPCAEITLRTPGALAAIKLMSRVPDMTVGAGTVTTIEQADAAIEAGAQFIVTPGFDAELCQHIADREVPFIPAAVTPSEIMAAQNMGINFVKFFPCTLYGGLPAIEALSGPFPTMKFMPTGGIKAENVHGFLSHPSVAACGGSWMVRRQWIKDGQFDLVTESCQQTMEIVRRLLRR